MGTEGKENEGGMKQGNKLEEVGRRKRGWEMEEPGRMRKREK